MINLLFTTNVIAIVAWLGLVLVALDLALLVTVLAAGARDDPDLDP